MGKGIKQSIGSATKAGTVRVPWKCTGRNDSYLVAQESGGGSKTVSWRSEHESLALGNRLDSVRLSGEGHSDPSIA